MKKAFKTLICGVAALMLVSVLVSCAKGGSGNVSVIQPSPTVKPAKTPAATFDVTKDYSGQLVMIDSVDPENNMVTMSIYSLKTYDADEDDSGNGKYENDYYDIVSQRQAVTLPLADDVVILMGDLFEMTQAPEEGDALEVDSDYFFENAQRKIRGESVCFFADIEGREITRLEVFWKHHFSKASE